MLQPALLGGVAIGVLSALPVINLANCCCAWILFGGGIAAYLLQQQRPDPVSAADGALVGLAAGAIGAVIWTLLSIPLEAFQTDLIERALSNASEMPPEAREFLETFQSAPARGIATAVAFVITFCISTVFAMIGGLFGALIFRKTPPPPPENPPFPPFPGASGFAGADPFGPHGGGGLPPPLPPPDPGDR